MNNEKYKFMREYVLARAATITGGMSGRANAAEAEEAWIKIQKLARD